MRPQVWAMCTLAPDNPCYAGWDRLGESIRARGADLVLHTHDPVALPHVDCRRIPIFPSDQTQFETSDPFDVAVGRELAQLEHLWAPLAPDRAPPPLELAALRAAGTSAEWRRRAKDSAVAAVLSWGSTLPNARLMQRVASSLSLPWWCVERGPFEGTFDVSCTGQGAYAAIGTAISLVDPCLSELDEARVWNGIRARYDRPADDQASERAAGLYSRISAASGPKVLFLGAFELGAGLTHGVVGVGERSATSFWETRTTIEPLAAALRLCDPAATLIVKPHPGSFLFPEDIESFGAIDGTGGDADELIRMADVVVSALTTLQWRAIFWRKPQVTLAAGPLLGRRIAYEAFQPTVLAEQLSRALRRDDFGERDARGRRLLCALFDRQLVAYDEHAPARLSVEHLAALVTRFTSMATATDTVATGAWLS